MSVLSDSSASDKDKKIAQLHDWLKLVDQKIKGLDISLGDEDEMTSAAQKQSVRKVWFSL